MAWVVKPSGSMKIDRRPEPYLTDEIRQRLERDILPRYEEKRGALLPALHEMQHAYGWIPPQALEEIAEFFGLAAAEVHDTASFYEEYWLKPKGRHVIAVCRSIACEVCDHKKITTACRERLNIEVGETTPDGRFTLVELECIGACGGAPAILIDESLHEKVTPQKMVELIDRARDEDVH